MPTTITVSECDDGGLLRANVGDTIEIQLSENATAGYRWALDDLDSEMFELTESSAEYPGRTIGCGGEVTFRFTVRAKGNAVLRLKYWRHWEGERGVRKRFTVDVEAQAR